MFVGAVFSRVGLGKQARHWLPLLLFAVLIGAQTAARTGDFGGFVDSTKPVRIPNQTFATADGFVLFWDGIPVNGDALSLPGPDQVHAGPARDLKTLASMIAALATPI